MANFLGILQSEWAGAQAFSSFDTYLAPYVFADGLGYSEVKKAIRSFIYNLNVPARWGQSPFTNRTVPEDLAEQVPMSGNRPLFEDFSCFDNDAAQRGAANAADLRYKHFLPEMQMINRAYYEIMTEGDKGG
jgi:ribonucleoside-triphosphate reductase